MNKKGITMISLVFYVLSFLVVVGVVGSISIFVTKNMDSMATDTDVAYSQEQVNKFFSKFINNGYLYEISKEEVGNPTNRSNYINFINSNDITQVSTLRYYPESPLDDKGVLFLEEDSPAYKKVMILDNVYGFYITETENSEGKVLQVKVKIRKGDEPFEFVLTYGMKR